MTRKKKMSKRIFLNMFIISSVVIVVTTVLAVGIVYKNFSKQNMIALKNELSATANGLKLNGVAFLQSFGTKHRITLVDTDGKVLFDNIENTQKMENHNKRKEIIVARKQGYGYSERYSDTISKKTINVAQLLNDGKVLRLSDTMSSIWSVLLNTFASMVAVMSIAIIISGYLSLRVSRAITRPINGINLSYPEKSQAYEEIQPLLDKIMKQNRQIEKQIEELNCEHKKQNDMRRDFTANVSHELKTPLTSISGFAEIIQNGLVKEEDIVRFAGKIHDEAQRLIILVGDIIKLSQLDGNDITVKFEPIDLYETSQAVMAHLESAADKKNVSMNLSGSHLIITGAEQIIEEMIFNIIDNAIKYNRDGGRVNVNIYSSEEGIHLSVEDTGLGIPKDDIGRIFERFYRVDKSHSKEIGGTGLGLSIVKHGANFHNAKVFVESEYNVGTVMTLVF